MLVYICKLLSQMSLVYIALLAFACFSFVDYFLFLLALACLVKMILL